VALHGAARRFVRAGAQVGVLITDEAMNRAVIAANELMRDSFNATGSQTIQRLLISSRCGATNRVQCSELNLVLDKREEPRQVGLKQKQINDRGGDEMKKPVWSYAAVMAICAAIPMLLMRPPSRRIGSLSISRNTPR
jgi:hypothetical protein